MKGTANRLIAVLISAAMTSTACATARWSAAPSFQDSRVSGQHGDTAVMAEYVQRLPPGTTIKVERIEGKSLRGTLMKATDRSLIIQPKTRIPEPAVEIVYADVVRITPDTGNGNYIGKAIGIGAAAGAGAALTVFFIILAAYGD
jgi:hypothetical protein